MCSRKWVTPQTSGVSSRDPVRTKKPRAADRADGLVSPMIRRPFASVWLWKGMGWFLVGLAVVGGPVRGQRLGPEGDDAEVPGRAAPQVADDGPGGKRVDGRLEFVDGAHAT